MHVLLMYVYIDAPIVLGVLYRPMYVCMHVCMYACMYAIRRADRESARCVAYMCPKLNSMY